MLGQSLVLFALIIGAMYLGIFLIIIRAVRPMNTRYPISTNWEELNIKFFGEPEDKVLSQLIHDHLEFMSDSAAANETKARAFNRASILVFAIVMVLIIAVGASALI